MTQPRKKSEAFFHREDDGSVRIRLRLADQLASLIEEAAGTTPLLTWIYEALEDAAREEVIISRGALPKLPPPEED